MGVKQMNITVTHTDNSNSLTYMECPEIPFLEGETAKVNEPMDIFINGDLQTHQITDIEIEDIDIEYVVSEKEWYVDYTVGLYNHTHLIKYEQLTYEDVKEYFE